MKVINGVVRLTVTKRQRQRQARSPKVVLEAQTKPQCLGHVRGRLYKKHSSCQPVVLLGGSEAFGGGV